MDSVQCLFPAVENSTVSTIEILALIHIWNLKSFEGNDLDVLGSRDVVGHVTVGLVMHDFLLVVNYYHTSILHRYGDIKSHS